MQGARPEIEVMWWDPRTTDFETGAALTRGLGRLKHQCISGFLPHVNEIIARCTELRQTKPNLIISLFGELIQTMLELIEKLQNLPTTFPKMVFWVTSLQRAFLELDALYNYITTPVAQFIGAFTTTPTIAQRLHCARVPFCYLRPFWAFDAESILAVVELSGPRGIITDRPSVHVMYSGNSTHEKIAAIRRAAAVTPWYRDPFETTLVSFKPGPIWFPVCVPICSLFAILAVNWHKREQTGKRIGSK
ncbi:hypothetical protein C8J57DRAFT_1247321 [Mycena rebaudengoi]|nr:hypothetical protein C8J57DRAFT_1247321 [Mycena rebaudengoi]